MAIRVRIDGQVVDMPEDQFLAGNAPDVKGAEIEVMRNGEKKYIPFSFDNYNLVKQSIREGGPYSFSTLEQANEESKQERLAGETAGAVVQGLPFAETIMKASGVPSKRLEEVERANPGAYWGSKLGSSLAVSLLPGGLLGATIAGSGTAVNVANALLSGVKLIGIQDRLATGAGNIVTEQLAKQIGKGALGTLGKRAASTLGAAAGGVADTAVRDLENAATDSFVYDTKFRDEIADGLSLRMMLGAGLPAAAGFLKDLKAGRMARLHQKVIDAEQGVASKAEQIKKMSGEVLDNTSATKPDLGARVAQEASEEIPHYGASVADHAGAALGMAKEVNEALPVVNKLSKVFGKGNKYKIIKDVMAESGETNLTALASSASEAVQQLEQLAASPAVTGKVKKALLGWSSTIKKSVDLGSTDQVEHAARIFNKMDNAKKAIDKLASKSDAAKEAADLLRSRLSNPEIVGKAVAELQGLNDSFHVYLGMASQFGSNGVRPFAKRFVAKQHYPDLELLAPRISTILKKAGDPLHAQKAQDGILYLLSADNFAANAAKRGLITAEEAAKVHQAATRASQAFQAAINTPVSKIGNALYDAAAMAAGTAMGGVAGAVLGPVVGRYAKPAVLAGKLVAGKAIAAAVNSQAAQVVKNMSQFFKGIRPDAAFQVASYGPARDDRKPEEILGRLRNQDAMLDGHPTNDAEQAMRAIEKAQTVLGFAPQDPEPSLADEIAGKLPTIPGIKGEKFKEDVVRLAEFPGYVSYLAMTGRLHKGHVQVMEAVHPEVLDRIRNQFMTYASFLGKNLSHKQKQQLSVLLGKDVDKSVAKKNASVMRRVYAALEQQQQPQALPGKMAKTLKDTADRTQMSIQSIEAGI